MQKWKLGMAAALFAFSASGTARAAELIILAGQGNISGARDLGAGFAQATGHQVTVRQERNALDTVNAGTPADIVIANPPVIDNLIKQGKVVGTRVDFARAGIGVAKEREVATALVKFMGAPENAALVRKSGLEPPER